MGIVFRQSLSNTIITYIGFGVGAINILFLYTRFLSAEYFGLVGVILSTSAILMPLLAFGVPNTLVKYYSSFKDSNHTDGLLALMLVLPLGVIVPLGVFSLVANEAIAAFLARKNAIVADYVWHIFFIGLAMAYFEVFYAWSKVQMKTVYGNFMKEVFARLGVTFLLFAVFLDYISVPVFLHSLVVLYALRMLLMLGYAFRLRPPRIRAPWPHNRSEILQYSFLIIFGGSASVLLLELDRFMINQFEALENVAYYSVAVFIATVIAVPFRSMHQVTYPLTAGIMNRQDHDALKMLYRRSSLTLFLVSGLIFILILVNLDDLYNLLPEAYRGGFSVVFLIGLVRVYDAALGINSSILYNSEYYKAVLVMGFFLALMIILFNLWLIPLMGINGAALASLLAIGIYDSVKLYYVWQKFGIHPFTRETVWAGLLLLALGMLFFYFSFPWHPILNIILKSGIICVLFLILVYRLRISEDVGSAMDIVFGWLRRKS